MSSSTFLWMNLAPSGYKISYYFKSVSLKKKKKIGHEKYLTYGFKLSSYIL